MELRKKIVEYKTPKDFWQKIVRFAYLSFGIPLVAFIFVYLEWESENLTPYFAGDTLNIVGGLFLIASIYFGAEALRRAAFYRKEARKEEKMQRKLNIYLEGATQKYKYLFFSAVTVTASLFITNLLIFPIAFAALIIIYSIGAPTLPNIAHDLGLKDQRKKDFMRNVPFVKTNENENGE